MRKGGLATVTLFLWGIGVPLAFGSPAAGIVLVLTGLVTGGLTIREYLRELESRDTPKAAPSAPVAPLPTPAQSLDLELRAQASELSDLRGKLKADEFARNPFGPPREYEQGMNAVRDRVTDLLTPDHPELVHYFLGGIGQSLISTVLPAGRTTADHLDHQMRVRGDRIDEIIRRLSGGTGPSLSFGRPEIPTATQPIYLADPGGTQHLAAHGRVIRVPVVNAQGAGDARHVHARLRFFAGGRSDDRQFGPGETEAEWFGRDGAEVEIDLYGNGRPRLIDVVAVLNWEYPYMYEWTTRSRAAMLRGYGIKSNIVEIEVTVMGSAPTVTLSERLEIHCDHLIKADWLGPSRRPGDGDTWVARKPV